MILLLSGASYHAHMEVYFAVMVALMCVFLGMGLWKLVSGQWEIGRKPRLVPARPGPQPKAVPPFPFGPISDLIRDAEAKAEKDFYELFPEERPTPFTGSPPGGYSMDSSPDGIIISNSTMTPDEWHERFDRMRDDEVMVLPESFEYYDTRYTPPKMIDVPTLAKPYRRYIQGIGIITADSEWKLDRACEVALKQKFDENEAMKRSCDKLLIAAIKTGRTMDLSETREKRREAWENCKMYLGLLQELNL